MKCKYFIDKTSVIARYYNTLDEYIVVINDEETERTYFTNVTSPQDTRCLYDDGMSTSIEYLVDQLLNADEITFIDPCIFPTIETELFEMELKDHEKIKAYNLLLECYYNRKEDQ